MNQDKLYKYYTVRRPPDIGTVPKDFVNVKSYGELKQLAQSGYHAWGEVEYNRRLTDKEIYDYELVEDNFEEKKMEALNGIDKNAQEIEKHVSDIVTASREDFLNLSVHMGELYLKDLIDKIALLYKEKFSVLHTDFVIDDFDNCLINGDSDRLEEVLQNILENAIKYGDGRYVRIKIGEEENKLIQITNSGCSLKEEELPHLFDSFYRGSNTEKKDGSGLGLYIAKTLMKMMDGDVFAKTNNDEFIAVTVVKKC